MNFIAEINKIYSSYNLKEVENFTKEISSIKDSDSNYDKDKLKEIILRMFDYVVDAKKTENTFFNVNMLLGPLLKISIYLEDNENQKLFYKVFNFVKNEAINPNNSSSRFQEILMSSARYFYENGKNEYVDIIINSLYQNKKNVRFPIDYGKFALPLPSPFDKKYTTIEEWETVVFQIISNEDIYPNWYEGMIEIFLSEKGEKSKYAYSIIRALYNTGKNMTPLHINSRNMGYEWVKEFYNVCGAYDQYFNLEPSVSLLENNVFQDSITLSGLISRLGYLKLQIKTNGYILSSEFDFVIETLRNALALSKKEQLNILKEQVNILYANLFENKKINFEILEPLIPVFAVLNRTGTSETFLEIICNEFITEKSGISRISEKDINKKFEALSYLYMLNAQKALELIQAVFSTSLKERLYGAKWESWSPENIEEARKRIPKKLQKVIFEYKDVEKFYNTIGIYFDFVDENSQSHNRGIYEPEYNKLFSFIPKFVLDIKEKKLFFKTLETGTGEIINVSEEQKVALEQIIANNNLALATVNDFSVESLNKTIAIIEQMLEDLKVISPETVWLLEISLENIKAKIEKGIIDNELKELSVWKALFLDKINGIYPMLNAITNTAISKTKNMSDKFDAFEQVLENNELALSALTKLTKMNEESINDTIYFMEEMLNGFEIISPDFAQKAKISLVKIRKNIEKGNISIEKLTKLNFWTEEKLSEIEELHTLINAVHQTSTNKLMALAELTDVSSDNGKKVILKEGGNNRISFYDCSKDFIKDEREIFL